MPPRQGWHVNATANRVPHRRVRAQINPEGDCFIINNFREFAIDFDAVCAEELNHESSPQNLLWLWPNHFVPISLFGDNMSNRLPCKQCGASILAATAERTGGLCMACKQGIRQGIQASKRYYEERRRYDPFDELWKSLVHRVYKTDTGYSGLSAAERRYYSLGALDGAVYRGGMQLFFSNTSGGMFQDIVDGLSEVKAHQALKLLMRAKDLLFDHRDPPQDLAARRQAMRQYPEEDATPDWACELEQVDKAYCEDPDRLGERMRAFAEEQGLVAPFRRDAECAAPNDGPATRSGNSGAAEGPPSVS